MTSLFDRTLSDGRSASDVLFATLDRAGDDLNFVDVGARNGSYLLPASYAKRACITGFEPNRIEYEKLVSGHTDAKAAGLREHDFKRRVYHPWAVWSGSGSRALHIPVGVGAATLMGPADRAMTANMWQANAAGGMSYYDAHQRPERTVDVDCISLDEVFKGSDAPIDILKIDVEGGELAVLNGAAELLRRRRFLFIYTEFQFTPYYQERVTLGHQQVLLDGLGYRLVSLNLDHAQYCWKPTKVDQAKDRWLTYGGDAVFMVDPDRNDLTEDEQYRLGLACIAFGFNAVGLNLVREAGRISASDLDALVEAVNHRSLGSRLHAMWLDAPHVAYRLLHRLGLK